MKIATYNIRHGADAGYDISKLARNITDNSIDIVGIQEIDMLTERVNGMDTMKEFAEKTGYPYYSFFKAIDFRGGEYGVSVLSRFPIVFSERIPLESFDKEGRVLGHTTIDADGINIEFLVTHLSFESDELRAVQFKQVNKECSKYKKFILTGDFNTEDFSEFEVIENAQILQNSRYSLPTFPGAGSAIDNIVYSDAFKFGTQQTVKESFSDHYMLYASCQIIK